MCILCPPPAASGWRWGRDSDVRRKEDGFSFIEVVVAVFILWLVAAPFVSMFVHSFQACIAAGEETQSLHLMQGILETILDPSATPAATGGFVTHPAWPRYEYRIMVQPHSGVFLDRVTVELRDTGRPGQVISFTTLKARRKLYETASFQ